MGLLEMVRRKAQQGQPNLSVYAARTSGAMGGAKEAIASFPLPYTLGEEIIESMDRITALYTRVFQASANK